MRIPAMEHGICAVSVMIKALMEYSDAAAYPKLYHITLSLTDILSSFMQLPSLPLRIDYPIIEMVNFLMRYTPGQ